MEGGSGIECNGFDRHGRRRKRSRYASGDCDRQRSNGQESEAALFTVYVENADATTALTFALASTTVDERFILDDLTVDVHDGPIALTPVILADDITGVAAAGVTDATSHMKYATTIIIRHLSNATERS